MLKNFIFTPTPRIIFGSGTLKELPGLLSEYQNILLVTGGNSFKNSSHYTNLMHSINTKNIFVISVVGEPSPHFVDSIILKYKEKSIDVVVSIGGGSVVDAGKAISSMLPQEDSVMNYIEGFQTKIHPGTKIPFIAIPTSSGTGSEMTKNAVLSKVGENGFKKSLRHDNFIPNIAIIDPKLTLTCPKNITVSCGLDTFTQLLESYVSINSSPMTDALAIGGIESFSKGFLDACLNGTNDLGAREHMSYAAMISGIVLANAGLGTVHGFASPIGGFFNIPHGVVCATLLPPCTKLTIKRLLENKDKNIKFLMKYSNVGQILCNKKTSSIEEGCDLLVSKLYEYVDKLNIPKLSFFKVSTDNLDKIINKTDNKYNPINLSNEDLRKILLERL